MSFCQHCGNEAIATAVFCGACGNQLAKEEGNDQTKTFTSKGSSTSNLSDSWKNKFASIEKAGGPKLPLYRDLTSNERSVIFNGWGFFFGPFYYLVKGMWKKAIVLFLLSLIVGILIEMILGAMGINIPEVMQFLPSAVIFACRANIDFYKKMILGDNGWW